MIKTTVLYLLLFFGTCLSVSSVHAQESSVTSQKIIVIPEEQVVDQDYFAAADVVEIYGTINGDAYIAAGQITIKGTINGDALLVAGQINLENANITQNIRAIGGQITFDATIGRVTSLVGGHIDIRPDSQLAGNLVAAGGNLSVNSKVNGDITAAVGNLTLTNQVSGDITAIVSSLRLTDQAVVQGNITYYSDESLSMSPTTSVFGAIEQRSPESLKSNQPNPDSQSLISQLQNTASQLGSGIRFITLVSQIILGLILIYIFPNYTARSISFIDDFTLKTFATGIITLLVVPMLIVILAVTIIGIPIALISLCLLVLLVYFSQLVFMYWLGTRFLTGLKRKASKTITLLIGAGIFFIFTSISLIGPITSILATIFGTGSLILTDQKTYQSARKLKLL